VKNPNIVEVRFIEPVNEVGFINETSTKNHFFTSLLEGAGFEIVDLGVDVSREKFIETAKEKKLILLVFLLF